MKFNNEIFNQLRTEPEQTAWFKDFYELGAVVPTSGYIGSKQNMRAVRGDSWLRETAIEHSFRIIRLRRNNIMRAAISQIRAEQYAEYSEKQFGVRLWAVKKGQMPLGATEIDPLLLEKRMEIMLQADEMLSSLFGAAEVLDIEYEEIENNLQSVVRGLTEYLSLPVKPFTVPFEKATPRSLRDALVNFDEVRQHLIATKFAGFVSGPLTN